MVMELRRGTCYIPIAGCDRRLRFAECTCPHRARPGPVAFYTLTIPRAGSVEAAALRFRTGAGMAS